MSTVLIFDLDDTLYDERQFVVGGIRSVASHLHQTFGWSARALYAEMMAVLKKEGRGHVFNRVLKARGVFSRKQVLSCVSVYRSHKPRLSLYPEARALLHRIRKNPLYVVTDSNKQVQASKVEALNLAPIFKHIYITHRYGVCCEKPSTYCFDLIRHRERCLWEELVYIGDNPAKDFVNLNPLGVTTVRVLTGEHRVDKARKGYEARYVIPSLAHLKTVQGVLLNV